MEREAFEAVVALIVYVIYALLVFRHYVRAGKTSEESR